MIANTNSLPKSTWVTRAALAYIFLSLCIILPASVDAKTLTISKITNNPAKHSRKMQPFVDYLVTQLSEYGYTDGKLIFARDPQQLASFMRSGRVDMASDTPFAYAKTHMYTEIEPIAIRWKNGIKEYDSVIFARTDSGISSLKDLKGKKIAFEDVDSTSGFALPVKALYENQLKLEKLYSPRETPSSKNVTAYIFSGSEQTTAAWVLKNLVHAGAISSLEWQKAQNFLAASSHDLTAIYTSPPVPRSIEFVRSDLPKQVKQRLQKTLFDMHKKSETGQILKRYQKTSLFEPLSNSTRASLKEMEVLAKSLQDKGI